MYAVADHHDAVQRQAWLGAVPGNELLNGIFIRPPRCRRSQGVEHCGLGMIQIGEPEHCAVELRFALLWDHAGGLLCRSTELTHDLRPGREGGIACALGIYRSQSHTATPCWCAGISFTGSHFQDWAEGRTRWHPAISSSNIVSGFLALCFVSRSPATRLTTRTPGQCWRNGKVPSRHDEACSQWQQKRSFPP